MGFMDKAKKLADQAQAKLDEVQKQFNESQGSGSNPSQPSGPAVEYDEQGRPIAKPADGAHTAATPQQGDPVGGPAAPPPPADKTPHVAPEPGDTHTQGDPLADSSPKPSQPPTGGGITSGDPLAG